MKLLVSVIDSAEALAAVSGGAHLIDVKNPREGALGAGAPGVIRAVRQVVPPHLKVSAALGDLPALPGTAALAAVGAALVGAAFVKVGLRGTRTSEDALALLVAAREALEAFAPGVGLIACAYADAQQIGALHARHLPEIAARAGCAGVLVDTFSKGRGSLFAHLAPPSVEAFVSDSRRAGLLTAVAGSLMGDDLARAAETGADIVGVRSAACTGGDRKNGRVQAEAVAAVIARLGLRPAEVA